MAKAKEPLNPFYVALVFLGILFTVTACAYGVMAFRAVQMGPIDVDGEEAVGLMAFLDRHGAKLLAGELALLAVATVGAIATDRYWSRGAEDDLTPHDQPAVGSVADPPRKMETW